MLGLAQGRGRHQVVVRRDLGEVLGQILGRHGRVDIAVLELNRQALIDGALQTFGDGNYTATVTAKSLKLLDGSASSQQRQLNYLVQVELKAQRSLGEQEGQPIETIRTTSEPRDPARRVDVRIDVDN